ncbi:MaoC family dehydratase [Marinibaculum pumilum]|uniref:MaoC family dehydratase n=1 Tax=Marinibaculum pumilum TaxID=1766165 RepID=A0ABV7LAF0_9PROT
MGDPGGEGADGDGGGERPAPDFDPAAHAGGAGRWFEDFEIGERFPIPSRTLTAAHFSAFQAASGDNHPIHYDVAYCRARGHRDLLAHGYQVVILGAAGAGRFPFEVGDALVAFLSQDSRFLAPVYAGDTLYPMLELVEKVPRRTTGTVTLALTIRNQDGTLCLEGRQSYLVRRRPAAVG